MGAQKGYMLLSLRSLIPGNGWMTRPVPGSIVVTVCTIVGAVLR